MPWMKRPQACRACRLALEAQLLAQLSFRQACGHTFARVFKTLVGTGGDDRFGEGLAQSLYGGEFIGAGGIDEGSDRAVLTISELAPRACVRSQSLPPWFNRRLGDCGGRGRRLRCRSGGLSDCGFDPCRHGSGCRGGFCFSRSFCLGRRPFFGGAFASAVATLAADEFGLVAGASAFTRAGDGC